MCTEIPELINLKFALEMLYYLSAPFVAFTALIAIKQIRTSREISKTNSIRESMKLSADQCKVFSDKIIPQIDEIDKIVKEKNITYFKESKLTIDEKSFTLTPCSDQKKYDAAFELAPQFHKISNDLDVVSIYFTSGVANEMIAYKAFGNVYCKFIKQYAAFIIPPNIDVPSSLLDLFFLWNRRLENEKLEQKKESLQKELARTDSQVKKYHNSKKAIKPIGC